MAILAMIFATGSASSSEAALPVVKASPPSLHFSSTDLARSEAQHVTLTNLSRHQVEISFLPEPPDTPFTHGHSSCPKSLVPHESCSIAVWFKPKHWGPATGKLVYVLGRSPSDAHQVHLSGDAHPLHEGARLQRR